MDRFNLKYFEEHQSGNHLIFKTSDGTEVEQWASPGEYYMEEIRKPRSNYSTYKLYYFDTRNLKKLGDQFYKNQIGIWKEYDNAGKLISEVDQDAPFRFTIEELAKKMKTLGVDILTPGNRVGVIRSTEPRISYTIVAPVSPADDVAQRFIEIDGKTGRTISDEVIKRTKN